MQAPLPQQQPPPHPPPPQAAGAAPPPAVQLPRQVAVPAGPPPPPPHHAQGPPIIPPSSVPQPNGSSVVQSAYQRLALLNEQTWYKMGSLAELMGDVEKAFTYYESALRYNPYSIPALTQIASLYRQSEQFEKAVDFFQRIINIDGSNGEIWGAIGNCYLMMDELPKAYQAYQQAIYHLPDPKEPKLWYGIGILYDRYGSYEHAEEAFSAVMRMDPNFEKSNEIHFRLGIIYKCQKKFKNSLECFKSTLKNPPKPLSEADIWFQIGNVYELDKDYLSAKEAYEHVLRENPNHAKVLQQLGTLYFMPGTNFYNVEQAISLLAQSIEADNSESQSWYLLGRCYMLQKQYNKAYEAYQQAVYRDGNNAIYWCSIGVLYYKISQYRDALDAYSRAIRIDAYSNEVWFDLGILYEACNSQINDAIDAYQRASELNPNNEIVRERLNSLRVAQSTGQTLPPSTLPAPIDPPTSSLQQQAADQGQQSDGPHGPAPGSLGQPPMEGPPAAANGSVPVPAEPPHRNLDAAAPRHHAAPVSRPPPPPVSGGGPPEPPQQYQAYAPGLPPSRRDDGYPPYSDRGGGTTGGYRQHPQQPPVMKQEKINGIDGPRYHAPMPASGASPHVTARDPGYHPYSQPGGRQLPQNYEPISSGYPPPSSYTAAPQLPHVMDGPGQHGVPPHNSSSSGNNNSGGVSVGATPTASMPPPSQPHMPDSRMSISRPQTNSPMVQPTDVQRQPHHLHLHHPPSYHGQEPYPEHRTKTPAKELGVPGQQIEPPRHSGGYPVPHHPPPPAPAIEASSGGAQGITHQDQYPPKSMPDHTRHYSSYSQTTGPRTASMADVPPPTSMPARVSSGTVATTAAHQHPQPAALVGGEDSRPPQTGALPQLYNTAPEHIPERPDERGALPPLSRPSYHDSKLGVAAQETVDRGRQYDHSMSVPASATHGRDKPSERSPLVRPTSVDASRASRGDTSDMRISRPESTDPSLISRLKDEDAAQLSHDSTPGVIHAPISMPMAAPIKLPLAQQSSAGAQSSYHTTSRNSPLSSASNGGSTLLAAASQQVHLPIDRPTSAFSRTSGVDNNSVSRTATATPSTADLETKREAGDAATTAPTAPVTADSGRKHDSTAVDALMSISAQPSAKVDSSRASYSPSSLTGPTGATDSSGRQPDELPSAGLNSSLSAREPADARELDNEKAVRSAPLDSVTPFSSLPSSIPTKRRPSSPDVGVNGSLPLGNSSNTDSASYYGSANNKRGRTEPLEKREVSTAGVGGSNSHSSGAKAQKPTEEPEDGEVNEIEEGEVEEIDEEVEMSSNSAGSRDRSGNSDVIMESGMVRRSSHEAGGDLSRTPTKTK